MGSTALNTTGTLDLLLRSLALLGVLEKGERRQKVAMLEVLGALAKGVLDRERRASVCKTTGLLRGVRERLVLVGAFSLALGTDFKLKLRGSGERDLPAACHLAILGSGGVRGDLDLLVRGRCS